MPLSVQDIARICRAPLAAVTANWPRILDALDAAGLRSDLVEVAAAATIAVETARTFRPIKEFGSYTYFTEHYEGRHDLGNVLPGDGARFHGRGYIQITGRGNYRTYSHVAGVDLEIYPDEALNPAVSARILASYFATRRVDAAANAQDWQRVRRLVNGGLNGWTDFNACVSGLLEVLH